MRFILKMAWRDSRASRRRLLLYSLSVVLGIAALVAIGSFSADVHRAVELESKGLLGADLVVTSPAALPPALRPYLQSLGAEISEERMMSAMMAFPTSEGMLRLVQVRAVEPNFPFYGEIVSDPAGVGSQLKGGSPVALIEPTLMKQFRVKPGDKVKLGTTEFTVVGGLQKVPGEQPSVSTLAPRAFIPFSTLAGTGLAAHGSLVRYRLLAKLPAKVVPETVMSALKAKFSTAQLDVDTVAEQKKRMGRSLDAIDSFLSLVGFVALFLGGIGVASAVHVYVRQKISTVAILRCLGATAYQSFCVYVVQGMALGVFGAVLGAAAGVAIQVCMPHFLHGVLPYDIAAQLSWPAIGRGAGAGWVICVLFTLLPLLSIRKVSPLVALRSAFIERVGQSPDPFRILLGLSIVGAVVGFSVWQTRSVSVGLGFVAVLALSFGILGGLAYLVAAAARRWPPRTLPYVIRQGVANLHRPNNRTVLLILSLGLGTFLILTLFLSRTTLLAELIGPDTGGRANLIFIDVQSDQLEKFDAIVKSQGLAVVDQAPVITMKLTAVKGESVESLIASKSARVEAWALRREYRSTYRDALTPTEKLTQGKFDGKADPSMAVVPISIEESLAKDLKVGLGDKLSWDIQGVPMETRVTSLRTVEWRRMSPNFFVVFPAGAIDDAPKMYVAATKVATPDQSARLQSAVVTALPNVSAIDLTLLVGTLDAIFSKVAFAVEFMALFTVATGIIVLVGSVLTGRYQRIRETVLLRTLGAQKAQLLKIQFVEYFILGSLAAIVGSLLAVGANALVAHFIFHMTPVSPVLQVASAMLIASGVTLAAGFLANRGIADHPPLEVLRQET